MKVPPLTEGKSIYKSQKRSFCWGGVIDLYHKNVIKVVNNPPIPDFKSPETWRWVHRTIRRHAQGKMDARPSLLPPPVEEDVVRALAGDRPSRKRVKVQKSRFHKRLRDIAQWDLDYAAR